MKIREATWNERGGDDVVDGSDALGAYYCRIKLEFDYQKDELNTLLPHHPHLSTDRQGLMEGLILLAFCKKKVQSD